MINTKYDPGRIRPQIKDGRVLFVTQEYLTKLNLGATEHATLMRELAEASRCPPMMFFNATPEVLAILHMAPGAESIATVRRPE